MLATSVFPIREMGAGHQPIPKGSPCAHATEVLGVETTARPFLPPSPSSKCRHQRCCRALSRGSPVDQQGPGRPWTKGQSNRMGGNPRQEDSRSSKA